MTSQLFGLESVNEDTIAHAASMALPKSVFFVKPDYFDVEDAINPHMLDDEGELHEIDHSLAYEQWSHLVSVYEGIGFKTHILEAKSECPDMVFCANQTFPYLNEHNELRFVKSVMENDIRHDEVDAIASQLEGLGIPSDVLPSEDLTFEGMGDALWVPGKRIILAGYGFRSDVRVYSALHQLVKAPIITFELTNPAFYHLDTCLSILNENSALACKEAFTQADWQILKLLFKNLIEVSHKEADSPWFACNAHCPDQKHVLLQAGSIKTQKALEAMGFVPIPLQTSEFIKSGGSVFCMKQILFR